MHSWKKGKIGNGTHSLHFFFSLFQHPSPFTINDVYVLFSILYLYISLLFILPSMWCSVVVNSTKSNEKRIKKCCKNCTIFFIPRSFYFCSLFFYIQAPITIDFCCLCYKLFLHFIHIFFFCFCFTEVFFYTICSI